jgi:general secretion pathway protein K
LKLGQQQRGVALIVVLLIVALVSILATEMGSRLQLQVKRASNIKENNQAYWYAVGAEQYARKSIKLLVAAADGVIHLNQPWAQQFAYPIEGGGIEAELVDLQACFNLNGLREKTAIANPGERSPELKERLEAFNRLLGFVEPEIPEYTRETVRDSLADWLDADDFVSGLGAEDSEYESRPFPYMAANTMLANVSELRMVNGVEVAWLLPLQTWLCAIPGFDLLQVNVNTVSEDNAAVVAALANISVSDAKNILGNRPQDGFQAAADFLAEPVVAAASLSAEQQTWFNVTTQYFMLRTRTHYNNASFTMRTVFKVDNQNVSVVSREFGG